MKRWLSLSCAGLVACFSNPPAAQWHKPQRELTAHIKASTPTFSISALRAEAIVVATHVGEDLVLDLAEIAPLSGLMDTAPRTGTLARVNPRTGKVLWHLVPLATLMGPSIVRIMGPGGSPSTGHHHDRIGPAVSRPGPGRRPATQAA